MNFVSFNSRHESNKEEAEEEDTSDSPALHAELRVGVYPGSTETPIKVQLHRCLMIHWWENLWLFEVCHATIADLE